MLFNRLPSLFRHSHPQTVQTSESIELPGHHHPRQTILSRRSSLSTVEVPAVQDRKVRLSSHTSEMVMVKCLLYSRWLLLLGQKNEHRSSTVNRKPRRRHR